MLRTFLTAIERWFKQPQPSAAPLAGIVAAGPAVSTGSAAPPGPAAATGETALADVEHVQTLIGQVSEITTTVAKDVGQHRVNVQEISSELTAVAKSDPAAVASIVCKLVVANQELQSRLERAETTLSAHSRQLHDAISSARTDGLTGLMNRRALDEELRRCLVELQGQGRPAALLMLDVDHFKRFNDTFGHVAGDQALIHVAEMLRAQSRATDIVARYGGEEFAVIFTAATAAAVRERAERLRLAIGRRTVAYDGREMHVTASAGLAEASTDDAVSDWLKRADSAMYAAKKAGRNCAFESAHDKVEPLTDSLKEEANNPPAEPAALRVATDAAAELAAEAFSDTTFVQTIAKRIAEWRRGGATLTVILTQLDQELGDAGGDDHEGCRPMRLAVQLTRQCVREMDLLTRWKKDGLAILLPSTSAADAKVVARRLRTAFAECETTAESGERFSVSIGIAEGIEGNDARRVLERAWVALDAARGAGSANIYVHDGLKAVGVKVTAPARA